MCRIDRFEVVFIDFQFSDFFANLDLHPCIIERSFLVWLDIIYVDAVDDMTKR